jgi:cobalamin-dependent methionine synthase I
LYRPRYTSPAIHVLDASRSVVVVSSLLDAKQKEDYCLDIKEEYEDLRAEHYEGLRDRKYISYNTVKGKACEINWKSGEMPVKPSFLGNRVFLGFIDDRLLKILTWIVLSATSTGTPSSRPGNFGANTPTADFQRYLTTKLLAPRQRSSMMMPRKCSL